MRNSASILIALCAGATLLSACNDASTPEEVAAAASISVEPTSESLPTFEATPVEAIPVVNNSEPQEDPGLHLRYELQGAGYNNAGGSIIYVLVRNDNDIALPVEALPTPTLRVGDQEITPVDQGTIKLDLPLGAHASTNLAFAYDTYFNNLYNATFQIGNVVYSGNLVNITR